MEAETLVAMVTLACARCQCQTFNILMVREHGIGLRCVTCDVLTSLPDETGAVVVWGAASKQVEPTIG